MTKTGSKQDEILEFIRSSIETNGYPPSVREICQAVHLNSPSTVHGHLSRMEKKGLIKKDSFKTRTLVPADDMSHVMPRINNVPIVGKITAGQPILAVENIEEYFPLPEGYFSKDDTFILTVTGESMIEAGIFDGDYIIVNKQEQAKNGDIVVAMVDDNATVKTFYKEKDHIRLQPENSTMEPIIVPDAKVLGLVVGLFRKMR